MPAKLEAALKARGHDVLIENAGVSGDTTSAGLARLDWSIPDGTQGVILELGANDALRGLDPAITEKALDDTLARLKARGIPVLLTGMLAPPNMGAAYKQRFDAIYPALAKKYGVPLYPFFLDGVAGDVKLNQADGIHPLAQGVDIIVARMLPAVEAFLAQIADGQTGLRACPAGICGRIKRPTARHRTFRISSMQYRPLGRTGLEVSALCLGTMTFGQQNTEAEGHAQLDYALDHGINFLDTAEMYSVPPRPETQGSTERIIGSWMRARGNRDKIILATKVAGRGEATWLRDDGSPTRPNRAQVHEAVDKSLQRLGTDYIDLYQVHFPGRPVQWGSNPTRWKHHEGDEVAIEETLRRARRPGARGQGAPHRHLQ